MRKSVCVCVCLLSITHQSHIRSSDRCPGSQSCLHSRTTPVVAPTAMWVQCEFFLILFSSTNIALGLGRFNRNGCVDSLTGKVHCCDLFSCFKKSYFHFDLKLQKKMCSWIAVRNENTGCCSCPDGLHSLWSRSSWERLSLMWYVEVKYSITLHQTRFRLFKSAKPYVALS